MSTGANLLGRDDFFPWASVEEASTPSWIIRQPAMRR